MKIKTTFLASSLLAVTFASAQKIEKEITYEPEGKADITNLENLKLDKEKNELSLFFLTKNTTKKTAAEIVHFDLSPNYLKTDNIEETYENVKTKYKAVLDPDPAPAKPKEERFPLLKVEPKLMTGQAVFIKGYIVPDFNWSTGISGDKFEGEEKVKPKGDDGERVKYVAHWSNNDIINYKRTRSTVARTDKYGKYVVTTSTSYQDEAQQLIKGDKGDLVMLGELFTSITDPNLGKNYATIKYSVASLTKVSEIPLNFDVAAAPIYKQMLNSGNMAFIFQRLDQKLEFIELDYEGNTVRRFIKDAPTDGVWAINDLDELDNGDIIIAGLVSKHTFSKIGKGQLIGAPHLMETRMKELSDKTIGYQIMSVSAKGINFVTYTPNEEFEKTFISVDGDKKGKPYPGGYIIIDGMTQTKTGDFIVNGQKTNLFDQMGDMYIFYFNKEGKLTSNFATPILEKTIIAAEQQLVASNHSDDIYWVINEQAGQEVYGDKAQLLKVTKIAKINSGGKKINAFVTPGNGEYFLDEKYSISRLDDDTYLFFGWNKKGKKMMFSKLVLE